MNNRFSSPSSLSPKHDTKMNSLSTCPVCGKQELEGHKECPQCHSNLHIFSIVNSLPETYSHDVETNISRKSSANSPLSESIGMNIDNPPSGISPAMSFKWIFKIIMGIHLTVLLFFAVIFYIYHAQIRHHMEMFGKINSDLVRMAVIGLESRGLDSNSFAKGNEKAGKNLSGKSLTDIEQKIAISQSGHRRENLSNTSSPSEDRKENSSLLQSVDDDGFHQHVFSKKDTLWDLARKYWKEGYYYPILWEYNPWLSSSSSLNEGSRLKIIKNTDRVKKDYEGLVIRISNRVFFKYRARPQDTWKTIVKKFFTKETSVENEQGKIEEEEMASLIEKLNSKVLKPGERILIPLL